MSDEEINKFVSAVQKMKDNGVYDQFARLHSLTFTSVRSGPFVVINTCRNQDTIDLPECFDWAHGGPQFLPWHRQFLLLFEQELQKIDSDVFLPYWDWTVDNSTDPNINHLWSDSFMGGNGDPENHNIVTTGPFAYWPLKWGSKGTELTRKFPSTFDFLLPQVYQVEDLMSVTPYDSKPYSSTNTSTLTPTFRKTLEGITPLVNWEPSVIGYLHNNVHGWVNGEMRTSSSPNDPIFFLHHAFIDYLWSKWLLENPLQPPYLPKTGGSLGTNLEDYLMPWDGVHNEPSYEYQYQYADIATPEMLVKISQRAVPDIELGYVYEGLISYY